MALRLHLHTVVHRPIAETFAYLTDLRNLPEWAGGILACVRLDESLSAVGTRYRITAKPPVGKPLESTYVVRVYRENEAFGGEGSFGPIPFREVYRFVERPDGTEIRQTAEMRPRGLTRLLTPLMAVFLPLLIGSDLRRLKRRLEDGRGPDSRT